MRRTNGKNRKKEVTALMVQKEGLYVPALRPE